MSEDKIQKGAEESYKKFEEMGKEVWDEWLREHPVNVRFSDSQTPFPVTTENFEEVIERIKEQMQGK